VQQIRDAVARVGEAKVVVVVVADPGATPSALAVREYDPMAPDLTIPDFIAIHAPGTSQSTVADWCRAGEFPDTRAPDGTVIMGAYKLGRWYITPEGIRERQRRARTRPSEPPRPAPQAEARVPGAAHERTGQPHLAEERAERSPRPGQPSRRQQGARPPRRAMQDAWKQAMGPQ
jgi:hypothetical protein